MRTVLRAPPTGPALEWAGPVSDASSRGGPPPRIRALTIRADVPRVFDLGAPLVQNFRHRSLRRSTRWRSERTRSSRQNKWRPLPFADEILSPSFRLILLTRLRIDGIHIGSMLEPLSMTMTKPSTGTIQACSAETVSSVKTAHAARIAANPKAFFADFVGAPRERAGNELDAARSPIHCAWRHGTSCGGGLECGLSNTRTGPGGSGPGHCRCMRCAGLRRKMTAAAGQE